MNFLQLCQRVRMECGIAGEGLPTTVTGQTGALGKIVNRTARAWVDIQASRPYWKFQHDTLTFTTSATKRLYSVVADLARTDIDKWDTDSAFIYLTGKSDQTPLTWKDYQWFTRNVDQTYPAGRPNMITEAPGRQLGFNRTPDDVYTVTIDMWKTPELMANDSDIPALPEHFHDIIVWQSVMMYAGATGDTALYQYANSLYRPLKLQLVVDQGDMPSHVKDYPIAGRR